MNKCREARNLRCVRCILSSKCQDKTLTSSEHTQLQPHGHRTHFSDTSHQPCSPSEHSLTARLFHLSHGCKADGFPELQGPGCRWPHLFPSLTSRAWCVRAKAEVSLSGKTAGASPGYRGDAVLPPTSSISHMVGVEAKDSAPLLRFSWVPSPPVSPP